MLIYEENKDEKIRKELEKALLTYEKPSKYFGMLREKNELDEYFSEIKALINVIQSPIHHPEGNVTVA
ncbi:MAG: hypothetical protein RSG52_07920 [Terrisporobacter sp.]|uniref:hypothetical protein n=1 Tax=Terrisporobacter sp. TaxID=1965305 RepID=UPI002FC5C954